MNVACVTYGHSDYHDDVWSWLNKNSDLFDGCKREMCDTFDHWRSWGLLSLCGCSVQCYGTDDSAPEHFAVDYGEGVRIDFDGTATELISRLNRMTSGGMTND